MSLSIVCGAPRMDGHDVEATVNDGVAEGISITTNSFFEEILLHQLFSV